VETACTGILIGLPTTAGSFALRKLRPTPIPTYIPWRGQADVPEERQCPGIHLRNSGVGRVDFAIGRACRW
jgi:hypothetical protein